MLIFFSASKPEYAYKRYAHKKKNMYIMFILLLHKHQTRDLAYIFVANHQITF